MVWVGAAMTPNIETILAECLECKPEEVDTIIDMVLIHGTGIIHLANKYAKEMGTQLNYTCFLRGVEEYVLLELKGEIPEELHDYLATVTSGKTDHIDAKVFFEMCLNGMSPELKEQLSQNIQTDQD